MNRLWLIAGAVLLAGGTMVAVGAESAATAPATVAATGPGTMAAKPKFMDPRTLVGQNAPDFALKTLEGREVKLSQELGNVVVLDFWLIGCQPCLESFPHLEKVAGDAALAKQGLRVWTIDPADTLEDAKKFVTERKLTFTVLSDEDQTATKGYGALAFPTKVVIGRDGVIKSCWFGYDPKTGDKKLDDAIKAALAEKGAETRAGK